MSPAAGGRGRLHVEADLTLSVDDADGDRATARLHGAGTDLRLDVDRPEVLDAARPRGGLPDAAWDLVGDGVRLEVHGPTGRIATVDPARPSRLAGVLTGDAHVRPGPAAVGVGVRSLLRRGPGRVGTLVGVAAVLTAVVLGRSRGGDAPQRRA